MQYIAGQNRGLIKPVDHFAVLLGAFRPLVPALYKLYTRRSMIDYNSARIALHITAKNIALAVLKYI